MPDMTPPSLNAAAGNNPHLSMRESQAGIDVCGMLKKVTLLSPAASTVAAVGYQALCFPEALNPQS
jgi:hypothetical protein